MLPVAGRLPTVATDPLTIKLVPATPVGPVGPFGPVGPKGPVGPVMPSADDAVSVKS